MSQALLFALWLYQQLLSPLFAGSCRFVPSCSDYAMEAVRRHGPIKGIVLMAQRLVRCQPLASGGYDPVPDGPGSGPSDGRALKPVARVSSS